VLLHGVWASGVFMDKSEGARTVEKEGGIAGKPSIRPRPMIDVV
jgi:hypothetical protein